MVLIKQKILKQDKQKTTTTKLVASHRPQNAPCCLVFHPHLVISGLRLPRRQAASWVLFQGPQSETPSRFFLPPVPQWVMRFPGSDFQIMLFSLPVPLVKGTGSTCSLFPPDASLLFLAHHHLLPPQLFHPLWSVTSGVPWHGFSQ